MVCRGLAQDAPGAKRRRPRQQLFHDEHTRQRRDVLDHRVIVERLVRAADIPCHRAGRRLGRDVAGERPQRAHDVLGVASDAVQSAEVQSTGLVEISAQCRHGLVGRGSEETGPTTDRDAFGEIGDVQTWVCGARLFPCEKPGERHVPGGVTGFEQRHGAHAKPSDAERTAVPRLVVHRDRRAGQDEPTRRPRVIIDVPADVVPDRRHELPLVDEPWVLSLKQGTWRDEPGRSGLIVDVESDLTTRGSSSRCRLAAAAGALYQHGPGGPKALGQLGVGDSGSVQRWFVVRAQAMDTHM